MASKSIRYSIVYYLLGAFSIYIQYSSFNYQIMSLATQQRI